MPRFAKMAGLRFDEIVNAETGDVVTQSVGAVSERGALLRHWYTWNQGPAPITDDERPTLRTDDGTYIARER